MTTQEVTALLEQKFAGVRKDGLANIASTIAMLADTEEKARAYVDALTPDAVNSQIKTYRSSVDAEVSKGIKTNEEKLRDTYSFVEKTPDPSSQKPDDQHGDSRTPNVAELIKNALTEGLKPFQEKIAALEAKNINDARRSQLSNVLAGVPEQYRNAVLDAFGSKTFENDDAFNSYLTEQTTNAQSLSAAIAQTNMVAGLGASMHPHGNGGENVSAAAEAYIKSMAGATDNTKGREI